MKTTKLIALFAAAGLVFAACEKPETEDQTIAVESVSLDETISEGHELTEGATLDISDYVTVLPENATDKTVTYSSSKTDVATVSETGVITAIAAGKTVITVTAGDKTATFTLTVKEKPAGTVSVESITLADDIKNGKSLEAEQTLDISSMITVLPENATDKAVSYASSKETIATITDAGVINAVAAGETVITITSKSDADVKAEFTLTVTAKAVETVAITSIAFSADEKEYDLATSTEAIDLKTLFTVEPEGYTETIAFESSDPATASVDENGMMTLHKLSEGVTITAKAAESEVSDQITIKVYKIKAIRHNRHINEAEDPNESLAWNTIFWNGQELNKFPSMGGRNNSATACLDEDANYKSPETTKIGPDPNGMTVFCFTRPGKSSGGTDLRDVDAANYEIWFIIDMKESHSIDFFELKHLSYGAKNSTDMGTRVCGFTEISTGNSLNTDGNDLSDGIVIASNISYRETASDVEQWYSGEISISDVPVDCRYVKFMLRGTEHYDANGNNSGNTAQIKEIYLGYHGKVYSEE